jgi:hypothetical protein
MRVGLRKLCYLGLSMTWLAACAPDPEAVTSEDLTSKSAVEKTLKIKAYVYVDENASDYTIESAVQRQIRTAFGPLRIGKISVDDREFRMIDKSTFVKAPVQVVKKGANGERQVLKKVQKVAYTYTARALVEKSLASEGSFGFALLMGNYQAIVDEIIKDCTENYEHDREFASSFWYVWSPNEYSCKSIIQKETTELAGEGAGLDEGQVGEKEYNRRYLPISAELKSVDAPKTTYPEYDKLFGLDDPGKDRIVIYQILGVASHDGDPESQRFENDMGFVEYFKLFKVVADQWKSLKVAADSEANPLSFSFKGKTYTGTFAQLYSWVVSKSSFPSEISYDDQKAFRRAIHDSILLKWVKLEVPITVTASGRGSKNMTIEFRFLFGTESGYNVKNYFREAFKKGDVVLYDGHSYIGSGPLDPNNYSPADFSDRYQILFFNSCVSFNYYGVSYFKHKSSKQLDLVTNGLEVWINDGGKSMGQFMVALFDGKQSSWLTVLEKTAIKTSYWGIHDPNRAVDGELDNTFDPQATAITVKEGNGAAPLTVINSTAGCNQTVGGTIQLSADSAQATRVEFFAGGQPVGTDSSKPFTASFDTRTVANGSLEIKVKATDAAGATAEASCTLTVSNTPVGTEPLFSDDMESAQTAGNWTATGLWHLAANSTCATPGFASGANAFYFGQDAGCSYDTKKAVKGTLTSRAIAGVTATSKLSFQFLRDVEKASSGSYDKTSVEVAVGASTTFKKLWSKDCKDASQKSWQSSGELSLAEYAGKSIRIRFNFDSVDSYDNAHIGWLIDDVVVTP